MSLKAFEKILKKWACVINKARKYIVLGGGEPTIHQEFWDFVFLSKKYGFPWVATNGSQTDSAVTLAKMARQNEIAAILSIDKWHDPIDSKVIEAFKEGLEVTHERDEWREWGNKKDKKDRRGIRTVIVPIKGGKASNFTKVRLGCPCPGVHFYPDEMIKACGCEDSPIIGTIDNGVQDIQFKYYDIFRGCIRSVSAVYSEDGQRKANDIMKMEANKCF